MSGLSLEYWRERLETYTAFYDQRNLRLPHYTLHEFNDYYTSTLVPSWPKAISTEATYRDFLAWWHDRYMLALPADCPPPKPVNNKAYFTTLKDFLLLNGSRPRLKKVPVPREYEGTIFYEKLYRRFIYLEPWNKHVEVYEGVTKSPLRLRHAVEKLHTNA